MDDLQQKMVPPTGHALSHGRDDAGGKPAQSSLTDRSRAAGARGPRPEQQGVLSAADALVIGRTSGDNGAHSPAEKLARTHPINEPCPAALPTGFVWHLDRSCDVGRAMLAATRRLREEGCESAPLDSALLLAHTLGVNKAWLYAHPHRHLTEAEISRFEDLVRRRICQEPIAYLIGSRSFYALDIVVNRHVLIPRPETELLVEHALDYIRRLTAQGCAPLVADIGTGSGAIATAIAVNAAAARVIAVDISDDALAVAAQNIRRYGLDDRVQLVAGNLTDPLPGPVDVIVANLPYVAAPQLRALPATVRDFEPLVALDGGADGLRVFRAFFDGLARVGVAAKLRSGGRIYLEIGADQGEAVSSLAALALPGAAVHILPDYAGLDRIVVVET